MIPAILGFLIALAVGLTGIGGGTFAVAALLLVTGLPASEAVGTAFVFSGLLRLIAAPFYLLERKVHGRYFRLLLAGAMPGLVVGMAALRWLAKAAPNPLVVLLLGLLLVGSSTVTFLPRIQNNGFARKNARWLPCLAFPIGIESGFSSAGAGALGSVLLLNYSEMTPAEVVGTDLVFGLVLAATGSSVHWALGTISVAVLLRFVAGGVPGVVLGCLMAPVVPARKLKSAIAILAIAAGLQLAWSGGKALAAPGEIETAQPPKGRHPLSSGSHRTQRNGHGPGSLGALHHVAAAVHHGAGLDDQAGGMNLGRDDGLGPDLDSAARLDASLEAPGDGDGINFNLSLDRGILAQNQHFLRGDAAAQPGIDAEGSGQFQAALQAHALLEEAAPFARFLLHAFENLPSHSPLLYTSI